MLCLLYIRKAGHIMIYMVNMGLIARKVVYGIYDQAIPKPAPQLQRLATKVVASLEMVLSNMRITRMLIRLLRCAGWSAPLLFANQEDRFSGAGAHIVLEQKKAFISSSEVKNDYFISSKLIQSRLHCAF